MTVYTFNPLRDPRWAEFVASHNSASVFHTVPWLDAIERTYGYTPVVYTTSPPTSPLSNGILLCEIDSWLTGRRMVSVPFSDHCELLLDGPDSAAAMGDALGKAVDSGMWNYIELRPIIHGPPANGAVKSSSYYLHTLDLRPSSDELLRRTHKTAVQQPIRRAEREGLVCEVGNSERLLQAFYQLLILTRRRHQLPPQPIQWFRNLAASLGDSLRIRVAYKNNTPIASIVTLHYKDFAVYKYGCSDTKYQNLGGTALLLWKSIVDAKGLGLASMDFGRSDADNLGLIAFKERWGARSSELTYLRWSRKRPSHATLGRTSALLKRLFAVMPDALLQATGRILYRHVG